MYFSKIVAISARNTKSVQNLPTLQDYFSVYFTTGGKFVVADQKIAGRNKAPLHLHSKQSRKLGRSCFS
jgi:hypothetical protein